MLSFKVAIAFKVTKNSNWLVESQVNAEICTERNGVIVYRRAKVINKLIDGES